MREYDITVGSENVFAELLDLQASDSLDGQVEAHEYHRAARRALPRAVVRAHRQRRSSRRGEMWRIEQRIERLNDLGFDVDELDIVTDFDGDQVRIQPKVVELGHHQRELQALTGLHVEDAQARRLLNDIAAFTAHYDLGREDRQLVANRWLTEVYEPIIAMVPPSERGKLEPAEIFHEVLVAPVVPLRARRARGRHLRRRPRLRRERAAAEPRRGAHLGVGGVARSTTVRPDVRRAAWSSSAVATSC